MKKTYILTVMLLVLTVILSELRKPRFRSGLFRIF